MPGGTNICPKTPRATKRCRLFFFVQASLISQKLATIGSEYVAMAPVVPPRYYLIWPPIGQNGWRAGTARLFGRDYVSVTFVLRDYLQLVTVG
jgi:hypothetical protein